MRSTVNIQTAIYVYIYINTGLIKHSPELPDVFVRSSRIPYTGSCILIPLHIPKAPGLIKIPFVEILRNKLFTFGYEWKKKKIKKKIYIHTHRFQSFVFRFVYAYLNVVLVFVHGTYVLFKIFFFIC